MTRCTHTNENSWWEYDARGIPLTRVCDLCKKEKLSAYRPEVLNDANYEVDEDIEPDDWDGREYDGYSDACGYHD